MAYGPTGTTATLGAAKRAATVVAPPATYGPAAAAEIAAAREGEDRRKRRRLIVLLLLLLAAAATAWLLLRPDDWYDRGMTIGSYDDKPAEDVAADLDAQVAENEMSISCAPVVLVDAATGEAQVRVENIEANHVDQRFTVALGSGEVLYESGALAPGTHVQSVTLSSVPEAGSHECTVTFQGYDRETHEPRGGTAAVAVTMVVG